LTSESKQALPVSELPNKNCYQKSETFSTSSNVTGEYSQPIIADNLDLCIQFERRLFENILRMFLAPVNVIMLNFYFCAVHLKFVPFCLVTVFKLFVCRQWVSMEWMELL
jgi:hypothetical protein